MYKDNSIENRQNTMDISNTVEMTSIKNMASMEDIFSENETITLPSNTPPIPNMIEEEKVFSMTDIDDSGHPSSIAHSQSTSSIISEDNADERQIFPNARQRTESNIQPPNVLKPFGVKPKSPHSKSLPSLRSVARSVIDNSAAKQDNWVKNPSETSDMGESNHTYTTERDSRISSANENRGRDSSKETSLFSHSKDFLQLPKQNDSLSSNRWQNAVRSVTLIFLISSLATFSLTLPLCPRHSRRRSNVFGDARF